MVPVSIDAAFAPTVAKAMLKEPARVVGCRHESTLILDAFCREQPFKIVHMVLVSCFRRAQLPCMRFNARKNKPVTRQEML